MWMAQDVRDQVFFYPGPNLSLGNVFQKVIRTKSRSVLNKRFLISSAYDGTFLIFSPE